MAKKNTKKRRFASAAAQNGFKKGKKGAKNSEDEFFENDTKRRRNFEDENIESSSDEDGWEDDNDGGDGGENQDVAAEEETVGEVRKRVAAEMVNRLRRAAEKQLEEGKDGHGDDDDDGDGDDRDKELERDSLVGNILMQKQLEKSGRVRRSIASSVCPPQTTSGFQVLVKHLQPVTAVALSEDDSKGFSASKDGNIFHWDVHSGKKEQYAWPSEEVLKAHGAKAPEGRAKKRSKDVLALAVSSDGRYLASGGFDRHVHLWDARTREHIQAFSGHKGSVSCLAFRQGTSELFSGSYDRTIKIWNAEDRSYITTLFGHQSEVLTIDCLRKERALTVGRDRTMHLWKVPEESQLVFRAPASSLECCCFINNDEFLSGSDDGSIEHWSVLRKKPLHILKNAHALSTPTNNNKGQTDNLLNGSNGCLQHSSESTHSSTQSWVGSVAVCRSSDLAASGAGNGFVRLWQIESDSKGIKPLFELPLVGYVNSLAFASSGSFLAAGVGKEPRLGRWGSLRDACNGVFLHPLRPS